MASGAFLFATFYLKNFSFIYLLKKKNGHIDRFFRLAIFF